MRRALALLVLLSVGPLQGCADLPLMEGTISREARARAAPDLVALGPILAEGRRSSRAQAAQGPLQVRRAALSAERVADPGTGDLAERGRRLRERATRLRAAPV